MIFLFLSLLRSDHFFKFFLDGCLYVMWGFIWTLMVNNCALFYSNNIDILYSFSTPLLIEYTSCFMALPACYPKWQNPIVCLAKQIWAYGNWIMCQSRNIFDLVSFATVCKVQKSFECLCCSHDCYSCIRAI